MREREREKEAPLDLNGRELFNTTPTKNGTVTELGGTFHRIVPSEIIWTLKSHLFHFIWKL